MADESRTRIYFDANLFIYAMEDEGELGRCARGWFDRVDREGLLIITSELTFGEVLPGALGKETSRLLRGYRSLMRDGPRLRLVGVSRSTIILAAELRSRRKMKLPDAVHLATALENDCQLFLTHDADLKVIDQVRQLALSDVELPI